MFWARKFICFEGIALLEREDSFPSVLKSTRKNWDRRRQVCVQPSSNPDQTSHTSPAQPSAQSHFLSGEHWLVLDAAQLVEFFPAFSFKWRIRNPPKPASSSNGTFNVFRRLHIAGHDEELISLTRPFSSAFCIYLPSVGCVLIHQKRKTLPLF